MRPSELAERFESAFYNELGTVEEADEMVRSGDARDAFLQEAAGIFLAHGMQDRFGVSLLHRHIRCGAGERMIETLDVFEAQDAMITRPTAERRLWDRATPSVWALRGDAFVPLEYTADPLASDLLCRDDIPDAFLAAYREAAARSPVGRLMGLSVVGRTMYARATPDEIGLEYSNLLPDSSIVVMANRDDARGTSLETRWAFTQAISPLSACVQECIQVCHQGDGPGGHTGKQVHTPGRHKW